MEDTKEYIIKEAMALFTKYGLKAVTMDDLASQLGVSKKTLYLHFDNKSDLVKNAVNSHFEEVKHLLNTSLHKPLNAVEILYMVDKQISAIIKKHDPSLHFQLEKYYPEVCRTMNDNREMAVTGHALHNIDQGREEGLYRTDFDKELIASLYYSRIEFLIGHEDLCCNAAQLEYHLNQILEYHIRGIATAEGIAQIEKIKSTEQEL